MPRRLLSAEYAFDGEKFLPAGATSVLPDGEEIETPPPTDIEQAMREASEKLRMAWDVALTSHDIWAHILGDPSSWDTLDLATRYGVAEGLLYSECMLYWSKVEALTVHEKTTILPIGGSAAAQPVSLVDIALSEGLGRILSKAFIPTTEEDAIALARRHTDDNKADKAKSSISTFRDRLIEAALSEAGEMTGPVERDMRVVDTLAAAYSGDFDTILAARSPTEFPD